MDLGNTDEEDTTLLETLQIKMDIVEMLKPAFQDTDELEEQFKQTKQTTDNTF